MSSQSVIVPNISCGHCTGTIERELGDLSGVTSVSANVDSKQVDISWDDAKTNWPTIDALLTEIGFPATSGD